jgi:hypothetical protein
VTTRIIDGLDDLPSGSQAALLQARGYYLRPFSLGSNFPQVMAPGRYGFGKCIGYDSLLVSVNGSPAVIMPIGADRTEGVIGAGVWIGQNHYGAAMLCLWDAVTNAAQVSCSFEANGVVRAWRGEPLSGVELGRTKPGAFQYQEWFQAELKAAVGNAAGTVEVRINTVPVISLVSQDTQATAIASYDSVCVGAPYWLGANRYEQWKFDDLYVNDTDGAVNNDFLGTVRVRTQFTTAAGSSTDFTIGGTAPAATNWQAVQNTARTDASYVYSPDVGDKDLYAVQAIVNGPIVHAVQVRAALRQDDATQRIGRTLIRSGATTAEGGDHYTNQSYTDYTDIFELNPDTGLGWTGTEVNAITVGVKVQG